MPHRNWSRRRLAVFVSLGALALVAATAGLGGWLYVRSIDSGVHRDDVFAHTPESVRPTKVADDAVNVLLMGADSNDADAGSSRADTIILIHLPADRRSAQLISIPRDTWLRVPRSTNSGASTVQAKINAAFAWGGAPLMVRTVETFTGVRIDHTMVIDFAGFARIIDALGGVDVTVDRDFTSSSAPYHVYRTGPQHMDGTLALDYARQRKPFADGDFTRMRHQRAIIAAVFDKAAHLGLLTGPATLDGVIRSTAAAVTVDQGMSILDMAGVLRDLKSSNLAMLTSPSAGTGMVGNQSVVFANPAADAELYSAVRNDTVDTWLAHHPQP
jgi:LCP family protein required for cell wall assembly